MNDSEQAYQMMTEQRQCVAEEMERRLVALSKAYDALDVQKQAKRKGLIASAKLSQQTQVLSDRRYALGKDLEKMTRDVWTEQAILEQTKLLRHIVELLR